MVDLLLLWSKLIKSLNLEIAKLIAETVKELLKFGITQIFLFCLTLKISNKKNHFLTITKLIISKYY